jgi:hypothetical protein
MKNPAPYIREQLTALLHETITYNGVPVPCYSGNGEITPYQILLRDQSSTDERRRDAFNEKFEQVIEVVSEQETSLQKHIDAIGAQVMAILKPTPQTKGLADSVDYKIIAFKKLSQNYVTEESGEGTYINRLILRYSFFITQK